MKTVCISLILLFSLASAPIVYSKKITSKKNWQEVLLSALKTNKILQGVTLRSMKKQEKAIRDLEKLKKRYETLKEEEKFMTEKLNKLKKTEAEAQEAQAQEVQAKPKPEAHQKKKKKGK